MTTLVIKIHKCININLYFNSQTKSLNSLHSEIKDICNTSLPGGTTTRGRSERKSTLRYKSVWMLTLSTLWCRFKSTDSWLQPTDTKPRKVFDLNWLWGWRIISELSYHCGTLKVRAIFTNTSIRFWDKAPTDDTRWFKRTSGRGLPVCIERVVAYDSVEEGQHVW